MIPFASGQQGNSAKENDEKAQQLLRDKSYTFDDLLNKNSDAVADAKKIFALSSDPKIKQRTASILLSIGVRDEMYLNYLVQAAQAAMERERDMPWPILDEKEGTVAGRGKAYTFNPQFMDWCHRNAKNPNDEEFAAYYKDPLPWWFLAAAGDPRTFDILIAGLHFQNPMIVAISAKGLAKLQDPRAVDEVIVAARKAPKETREGLVEALVYLPGPKAQAAVKELSVADELTKYYENEAHAKGIKGLFGY